jgi:glycosyltransferase involved in cell wall biosynthesis
MSGSMRIVQIAPEIAPGSGVAAVAYELEQQFLAKGVATERFTLSDARGRPSRPSRSRLGHAWDVVWFSTVGTRRARRFLAQRPDAVSICHNDVMAGDIYVNHGFLPAAMRARGGYAWRMLRNPLHLFTAARDGIRYRGGRHEAVVVLTSVEEELLRHAYPTMKPELAVIGNGVDLDRFRVPTSAERAAARADAGYGDGDHVVVFIGHEFDRKGFALVRDALPRTSRDVVLLVVGGTPQMIASARGSVDRLGLADRVQFAGSHSDVVPFLWAADAFVLPSAYESSGLVFLEALATGVPVIAPAVGVIPDVVDEGRNGHIVERDAAAIAARITDLQEGDRAEQSRAARDSVARFAWSGVADRYLALVGSIEARRDT